MLWPLGATRRRSVARIPRLPSFSPCASPLPAGGRRVASQPARLAQSLFFPCSFSLSRCSLRQKKRLGCRGARSRGLCRALVVAFLIRAGDHDAIFAHALHKIFVTACRALVRNRPRCRGELALRIARASVKRVALARALFDQFAFLAQRALHADKILLHVLAIRVAAARSELSVAAMTEDEIAAAFRTLFV